MKTTLKVLLSYVAGFASGYFVMHKRSAELIQKQVDMALNYNANQEVKEETKHEEVIQPQEIIKEEKIEEVQSEDTIGEYVDNAAKYNTYSSANDIVKTNPESNKRKVDNIYIITADEYYQYSYDQTYEIRTLTYYSDDVLADEDNNMIKNVSDYVGFNNLSKIGDNGTDIIYICNDIMKTVFEVEYDSSTYKKSAPLSKQYEAMEDEEYDNQMIEKIRSRRYDHDEFDEDPDDEDN